VEFEDRLLRAAKIIALIVLAAFMVEVSVLLPKVVNYAHNIDINMGKIRNSIAAPSNPDDF
jgi:aconitase A